MAAAQKRLITAPTSKLGKVDLISILRRDDAWILLPPDVRQNLYSLLPQPREGEPQHDTDVHPLNTMYKPYIEEELRRFQTDLKEGREQKKWREEAMQAGRDRADGKFDEWKEVHREEYWGKRDSGVVDSKAGLNGDAEHVGEKEGGDSKAEVVKDSEDDKKTPVRE